ncbi:MAG: elongation factor G, partial [Paracoccaceae bacterium]
MRLITVMGPSHSGKSTLVAQLAALDGHGAKVETAGHLALTSFSYLGEPWAAVDMAGGPEFARMVGSPLMASDAAVLCVPPDPDAAVLAAPYLRAIEASGTPCLIFVNQMDAPKGRVRDIVAGLQAYTSHAIVLRQIPIRDGGQVVGAVDLISERAWRYRPGQPSVLVEMPQGESAREQEARAALLEHMSDFDDELLAELIEDHEPAKSALFNIARRETSESVILPCFMGSATQLNGVTRLMKALRHEVPGVEALAARLGAPDALAAGFHAQNRKHLGKCLFLRALRPGVTQGTRLAGDTIGGLTSLVAKSAGSELAAGDIGLAVKADHLSCGMLFGADRAFAAPDWARPAPPSLERLLIAASQRDEVRLSTALSRLCETDAALALRQDETSGHSVLRLQGPIHLRQTLSQLAEDFGVEVTAEPTVPQYRETISASVSELYRHRKQSGGAGQFADVALTIEPLPRGVGFQFSETVKGGAVPRNYIPAVEEGAREALAKGPLGFTVIDLSVTLTDGKFHAVDSSDFAFRTAGRQGVKEALTKAAPVLLQPVLQVELHIPSVFSGAMVSLISSLKGQVLGF